MPNYNYVLMSDEQIAEIEEFLSTFGGDGFKIVSNLDLPDAIPDGLVSKIDSAMVIVSGSEAVQTVAVWNNFRVDERPQSIDEHPFAVILISGSVFPSGSIVDHGDWPGRTSPITPEMSAHIHSSGIGDYFLANPPEGVSSGSLEELSDGKKEAFVHCLKSLTQKINEE